LKRLMPSLRSKKRYLAFELISEEPVNRGELVREVVSSASALGNGIIQCSHTKVTETRAALAAITQVNRVRATLHVLGVSGTVKGATEKYLKTHVVFEPKLRAAEE